MGKSIINVNTYPLVSVIVTFYNSNDTIGEAISSIVFQSYQNWEIIFIDDGSAEDPSRILKKFSNFKINYIKLEKNYGRGYAYQRGIDNAKGEFVMFLDSDDWWYSSKMEEQINYMLANNKTNVLGTGIISAENNFPRTVRGNKTMHNIKLNSLEDPPLAFASICIRKFILIDYRFDEGLTVAQDIDFLQVLLMNEHFSNLSNVLYVYNEYGSFKRQKMQQAWINRISSLSKLKNQYPLSFLKQYLVIKFKIYFYDLLFSLNMERFILNSRGKKLSLEEHETFELEYSKLRTTKSKYYI